MMTFTHLYRTSSFAAVYSPDTLAATLTVEQGNVFFRRAAAHLIASLVAMQFARRGLRVDLSVCDSHTILVGKPAGMDEVEFEGLLGAARYEMVRLSRSQVAA